jgi:hypothetical protein
MRPQVVARAAKTGSTTTSFDRPATDFHLRILSCKDTSMPESARSLSQEKNGRCVHKKLHSQSVWQLAGRNQHQKPQQQPGQQSIKT